MYKIIKENNKLILKVNNNLDDLMFGISDMHFYMDSESDKYTNSMVFYFNEKDVKVIYSSHETTYMSSDRAIIEFYDGSKLVLVIDGYEPGEQINNVEKIIKEFYKLKMMGTKWEQEYPEKYI